MTTERLTREQVCACIEDTGIIPAIRVHSEADAVFAARAVFEGGIPIVEITMTTPGAIELIGKLRTLVSHVVVGAGTVLDVDMANSCISAGAAFLTSPGFDPAIAEAAERCNIVCIPGALTPTEVMFAARTHVDFIKIFPCAQVGGAAYINAIKRPFPEVRLIASGGVTQKTAADLIRGGASALGIGEELIPPRAIRERNESWIHELSRRFLGMVHDARAYRHTPRQGDSSPD